MAAVTAGGAPALRFVAKTGGSGGTKFLSGDGEILFFYASFVLGVGRFHVDVEGIPVTAGFCVQDTADRFRGVVQVVGGHSVHLGNDFEIVAGVLGSSRLVWQRAVEQAVEIQERLASADEALVVRTVTDGLAIDTKDRVHQENCIQNAPVFVFV